jgi:hypothetical protein
VFEGWHVISSPQWLEDSRWKPQICLGEDRSNHVIAVDIISSGVMPRMQYRGEVNPLLKKNSCLRVVVCVVNDALEQHPDVEDFCKELRLGLKIYRPSLGVETVLRTDFEPPPPAPGLLVEQGWFPDAILERTRALTNLSFRQTVHEFSNQVKNVSDNHQKTCELVTVTIDSLMQEHPTFGSNVSHFMKLQHFERLFEFAAPGVTDHVLHSFRIFLAGCAIIDSFYDHFRDAHERYRVGSGATASVEYAWLLASVFHDIGRPKEGAAKLIEGEIADEDVEIQVRGNERRWLRPEYQNARKALACFATYVASNCPAGGWDGGSIEDADAKKIETAWTAIYDSMRSHAIIGALDLLAQVFSTASAANERKNRAFVVSHAVPAALAILLHDWRIWEDAKDWGLFPVNGTENPMAALLIYLDTWDDYSLRGQ